MIFLLAASIAAASPSAARCPEASTPDSLVCRALGDQHGGDSTGAAQKFEAAANLSSPKDPKTARLLVAAANMWIAADQPGKAAAALDRALSMPGLDGTQRGEALLDRARAAEELGDLKTAREKITEAERTVGDDPFAWYFSSALAIREHDIPLAQDSIAKALSLAPNDPTLLFEAGHVALTAGDEAQARSYWARAAATDKGEVGQAAAKAIEMLGVTPVVKIAPAAPK